MAIHIIIVMMMISKKAWGLSGVVAPLGVDQDCGISLGLDSIASG